MVTVARNERTERLEAVSSSPLSKLTLLTEPGLIVGVKFPSEGGRGKTRTGGVSVDWDSLRVGPRGWSGSDHSDSDVEPWRVTCPPPKLVSLLCVERVCGYRVVSTVGEVSLSLVGASVGESMVRKEGQCRTGVRV